MMSIDYKYVETGQVRPPNTGEWFRTSRGPQQARFDFGELSFPILEMRVIEIPGGHVACRGFLVDDNDPDSWSGCGWLADCPVCHGEGHHKEATP